MTSCAMQAKSACFGSQNEGFTNCASATAAFFEGHALSVCPFVLVFISLLLSMEVVSLVVLFSGIIIGERVCL